MFQARCEWPQEQRYDFHQASLSSAVVGRSLVDRSGIREHLIVNAGDFIEICFNNCSAVHWLLRGFRLSALRYRDQDVSE
jgi:hypothetical protein